MIYTHVLNRGGYDVTIPADKLYEISLHVFFDFAALHDTKQEARQP